MYRSFQGSRAEDAITLSVKKRDTLNFGDMKNLLCTNSKKCTEPILDLVTI